MIFHVESKVLALAEIFRIAHGASHQRVVVRAKLGNDWAEAPLVPYYGESVEAVLADLALVQEIKTHCWEKGATKAARLLVDVLRHKTDALPIWQQLVLPDPTLVQTLRSLSIHEDLSAFAEQVRYRAQHFSTLKLKLGSGNVELDEALVARAREVAPQVQLVADVNGGWQPKEAARMMPKLQRWGLTMLEQPVTHKHGLEPWKEWKAELTSRPMPVYADESTQTIEDLPGLKNLVDGVNVKLLKTAGITGAVKMIHAARAMKLGVMLGCMIESSLGIHAAWQLAGLADWVDLDGPLYLREDDMAHCLPADSALAKNFQHKR
jgi:L-alanine-DL-glutamate epimerase-like enolase superfamily enzyme